MEKIMKLIFCLFVITLMACAGTTTSHAPMKERLISKEKRITYIKKEGRKYSDAEQAAFLDAAVVPGLSAELVKVLYGKPNKIFYENTLWYYTDTWDSSILRLTLDKEGKVTGVREGKY